MATPRFDIPELAASQAQKYLTVNEGFNTIDAALNLNVIRSDNTNPPVSPNEGDKYIIASVAAGDWTGREDQVAAYIDGAWRYFLPVEGWRCYDQNTDSLRLYDGAAWVNFTTGLSFDILGVNATATASNRLVVASDNIIFSWDNITPGSGSCYVGLNKDTAGDDTGFFFQQGFTNYAGLGLTGDNNFTLKVGTGLTTAMVAYEATGTIEFTEHPKFSGYCNFDNSYPATVAPGTWVDLLINAMRHNDQGDTAIAANVITFTAPHDGYYLFSVSGTVINVFGGSGNVDRVQIGFSINGAAPNLDTTGSLDFLSFSTRFQSVGATSLLKLSSGDTVNPKILINIAVVAGENIVIGNTENYFNGCQIA